MAEKPQAEFSPAYAIPAGDICMSDPMPFGQHWQARVPIPIASVGDFGEALQSRYASMQVGDTVDLVAYQRAASGEWVRVVQRAQVLIVYKDETRKRLEAIQIGKTFHVPERKPVGYRAKVPLLTVAMIEGQYHVFDESKNIVQSFLDEAQAREFADRENAIALKAAERTVRQGFGKWDVRDSRGNLVGSYKTKEEADIVAGLREPPEDDQEAA